MTDVGTAGRRASVGLVEHRAAELTGRLAQIGSLVGCPSVSVTEGRYGRQRVVAATDERARRDEQLQHEVGEGPSLQALRTGHSVLTADVRSETRWPRWCARTRQELDTRAVLVVPLLGGGRLLGVVSLGSRDDLLPDLDLTLVHRGLDSLLTSPRGLELVAC